MTGEDSAAPDSSSAPPASSPIASSSSSSSSGLPTKSVNPSSDIPPAPHTSYQLEKDWKQLQKNPLNLYHYFKQIPPSSYTKILQQSLDSNLLNGILRLILDFYIPSKDPIMEMLQRLCSVRRFDMNVMFMSKQDKKVVEEIFAHLRTSGEADGSEIKKLAVKYGL